MDRFRSKRVAVIVAVAFMAVATGCSKAAQVAKRKPIYRDAKSLVNLPKKVEKKQWPKGSIISLEKGTPAPFAGILLTEPRALAAGKLRIAYDELYNISAINTRLVKVVLNVADESLKQADEEIRRLREKQNSWWSRNKLSIGIVGGFVIGVSLAGLVVWGAFKAAK